MKEKSGIFGDKSSIGSNNYRDAHSHRGVSNRKDDGLIRDRNRRIAYEFERHGWTVEYCSDSELGFSKKA
jgi:hypothetical protein